MEERVFFNLGNAVAADFDTKELERKVQVIKAESKPLDHLVLVTDPETGKVYLFDNHDQEEPSKDNQEFQVEKHIH